MSKDLKTILIIVGSIIVLVLLYFGIRGIVGIQVNNNAVDMRGNSKTTWSNVESAYQRRSDLIPNLVNTVKGAANFEKSTLTDVINARAKATSVNINADNLSADKVKKFQQAQNGLSGALSRLLVSVERYPELKATQNFQTLQSQLEGTENRINVARNRYNEAVNTYNNYIQKFPFTWVGDQNRFEKMTRFEADKGAEKAPEVKFPS